MSKEDAAFIEAVLRFVWKFLVLVALVSISRSLQKIAWNTPTAHVEVTSEQEAKR